MALFPRKDEDSFPIPRESIEAFRSFLVRIKDDVFDDNAARMADAIGYGESSKQRKLRRILSGETDKIENELVRAAWDELFNRFGTNAFKYAPTPHGAAFLPRLIFKPKSDGDSYVASPEMQGRYVIDPIELNRREPRSLDQKFVVPVEGDGMVPELRPGMQIVIEPSTDDTSIPFDGLYLYRHDGTVQIRRLQKRSQRQLKVMFANEDYDDFLVDVEEEDFEILGAAWGRYRLLY